MRNFHPINERQCVPYWQLFQMTTCALILCSKLENLVLYYYIIVTYLLLSASSQPAQPIKNDRKIWMMLTVVSYTTTSYRSRVGETLTRKGPLTRNAQLPSNKWTANACRIDNCFKWPRQTLLHIDSSRLTGRPTLGVFHHIHRPPFFEPWLVADPHDREDDLKVLIHGMNYGHVR
jgi:hypothetical protein